MGYPAPNFRLTDEFALAPIHPDQHCAPTSNYGLTHERLQEGCAVNLMDWVPQESREDGIVGDATFSITLMLEGSGHLSVENGPGYAIERGTAFLFKTTRPTCGVNKIEKGQRLAGVDFRYPQSFFDLFASSLLPNLGERISNDAAIFVRFRMGLPLTRLAHETLSCPLTGMAREMYLRAKALEALALIIAQNTSGARPALAFKHCDELKIQLACEVLEARFAEAWTIARLSKEIGVNQNKLKQGFRAIAQNTVHGYLERVRMSEACKRLTDASDCITTIALDIGYSNASHFAQVFRKCMGASPREWRNAHSRH